VTDIRRYENSDNLAVLPVVVSRDIQRAGVHPSKVYIVTLKDSFQSLLVALD
jgi:hypothetical protein